MFARLSKFSTQLRVFKPTHARNFYSVMRDVDTGVKRQLMTVDNSKTPVKMSVEEAAALVKSGDKVYFHSIASVPVSYMKALANHVADKQIANVESYHTLIACEPIVTVPKCHGLIRDYTFFVDASCRKAVAEGQADTIFVFLSEIPRLFRREVIKLDYSIIQVSPPDERGFVTLGPNVDCTKGAAECSKKLIAIVNKTMPKVYGTGSIHLSQIDILCHDDTPIATLSSPELGEKDLVIGKLIADNLIDNGSTLQIGIGSIPDAVLASLKNHKDLGIHTEMASDGIIDLMKCGAVNNRKKVIYPGKTVTSFAYGAQRLYDFVEKNDNIYLEDTTVTNDSKIISQNPKVASINSCIEVDLTGQVASDSIGKRIYSGIGGQLDFMQGANSSVDGLGKTILTFYSTTNKGASKIVPVLSEGAGVSATRSNVRFIVTEYGIADLYGKGLHQRARALINISHPDHREALEKAAFERYKRMP